MYSVWATGFPDPEIVAAIPVAMATPTLAATDMAICATAPTASAPPTTAEITVLTSEAWPVAPAPPTLAVMLRLMKPDVPVADAPPTDATMLLDTNEDCPVAEALPTLQVIVTGEDPALIVAATPTAEAFPTAAVTVVFVAGSKNPRATTWVFAYLSRLYRDAEFSRPVACLRNRFLATTYPATTSHTISGRPDAVLSAETNRYSADVSQICGRPVFSMS